MMRWLAITLCVLLPLVDLAWNLTHLNIGLVDFYGLTLPALGLVQNHIWPATPYFPAGYPLLLIPFGLIGSTLVGGYVFTALGAMLALTGVRRLALELGASDEWTLAAVALAWAEPTFRVTSGAPTPDMLFTGVAVWFLWSAVAIWRNTGDEDGLPALRKQVALLALCSFVLLLLRYHAYVLVLPILVILIAKCKLSFGSRRKPFEEPGPPAYAWPVLGAIVLALLVNFLPYYLQVGHLMSSAASLQVRVGLEADTPAFYTSTDELFKRYSSFADFTRQRSVIIDYGFATVAKHTLKQLARFLRRPPVAAALLLVFVALVMRRNGEAFTLLALWMVLYSLVLSVAYYTPRSAVLVVLVGIAVAFALLPRLFERKPDLALAAACAVLLLAYWPAGQFARADFAQRAGFAELSQLTATRLAETNASPDEYIAGDMRIIRLPRQDNPWQKPYISLDMTWLNDLGILSSQLPGYRDVVDEFTAPVSPDLRDGKSPSGPPASAGSRGL